MVSETDREAAADENSKGWHDLSAELRHEGMLFGLAGSDEAWHQNKFISTVLRAGKRVGEIFKSPYFEKLRAKLDGSRLIADAVMSKIYGDKKFSKDDPRSAETAGHRSIIEELDILLPILDASSPEVRENMFSSVYRAGALQRMAGYSKMVERPKLFKIEGERLAEVIDDAANQLGHPADDISDTSHYAAIVLMKSFSEISKEQHLAIRESIRNNPDGPLHVANAVVEYAPSLLTYKFISRNVVRCLERMNIEQSSRALVALANEAATLDEDDKTNVAQLSLQVLEDNEETDRHRKMAALALAKTYDALDNESQSYVENMKTGDNDLGQMLRSAFNQKFVASEELTAERHITVDEINTATVKDLMAIHRSSNEPNAYLAAKAMSKVTRESEKRVNPARAALMQSHTSAGREGL